MRRAAAVLSTAGGHMQHAIAAKAGAGLPGASKGMQSCCGLVSQLQFTRYFNVQ